MKIAAFFIGLMIIGMMSACTTVQINNPQVQVRQVCANLSAVSAAFEATPGALTDADRAKLEQAKPIVAKVCAVANAAPSKPDLHSVAAVAVPVLLDVVQDSTLPGQTKLQIALGVNLAKSLIAQQLAEEGAEASAAQ